MKTNPSREAKIYLRAAARVHESRYSCNAIVHEEEFSKIDELWPYRDKYCRVMWAKPLETGGVPDLFLSAVERDPDPLNLRIWLLCMMAACCGDFE